MALVGLGEGLGVEVVLAVGQDVEGSGHGRDRLGVGVGLVPVEMDVAGFEPAQDGAERKDELAPGVPGVEFAEAGGGVEIGDPVAAVEEREMPARDDFAGGDRVVRVVVDVQAQLPERSVE